VTGDTGPTGPLRLGRIRPDRIRVRLPRRGQADARTVEMRASARGDRRDRARRFVGEARVGQAPSDRRPVHRQDAAVPSTGKAIGIAGREKPVCCLSMSRPDVEARSANRACAGLPSSAFAGLLKRVGVFPHDAVEVAHRRPSGSVCSFSAFKPAQDVRQLHRSFQNLWFSKGGLSRIGWHCPWKKNACEFSGKYLAVPGAFSLFFQVTRLGCREHSKTISRFAIAT